MDATKDVEKENDRNGAYLILTGSEIYPDFEANSVSTVGGIQSFSDLTEDQQSEAIKSCVRYMLCAQVNKKPVRTAVLSRHMLKNIEGVGTRVRSRLFQEGLEKAQEVFKNTLGMELVEVVKNVAPREGHSSGFILVSILEEEARPYDEEAAAITGFITVVAAMILLTPDCKVEQEDLKEELKKLGVHVRKQNGHAQLNGGNVQDLLQKKLVEQWYLVKETVDEKVYYKLGPRIRAELSDDDFIECVNDLFLLGGKVPSIDKDTRQELKKRLEKVWSPLAQ